jgi:hypothetical protein
VLKNYKLQLFPGHNRKRLSVWETVVAAKEKHIRGVYIIAKIVAKFSQKGRASCKTCKFAFAIFVVILALL